jgi:hypothetical protein
MQQCVNALLTREDESAETEPAERINPETVAEEN